MKSRNPGEPFKKLRPGSQVVRQRSAKPLYVGAIPAQASGPNNARVVKLVYTIDLRSIAARRVGSTPTSGTGRKKQRVNF